MLKKLIKLLLATSTATLLSSSIHVIDYSNRMDQLMYAYILKLEKSKKFILTSIGGGMLQDINCFIMSFDVPSKSNVQSARQLYIETLEEFRAIVNADPLIRPMLISFPFPPEGIELNLSFEKQENCGLTDFSNIPIAHVHTTNGITYYYTWATKDPNDRYSRDYKCIHKEPYEEAYRIVKESGDPNLSTTNLAKLTKEILSDIPLPPFSKEDRFGPKVELKMRDELDKIANRIAKENHWDMMRTGFGLLVNASVNRWTVHWASDEKVTLEQARPIARSTFQALWKEIRDNPLFLAEQQARAKDVPRIGTKVVPELIGFKINFWDENVNRPKEPYLAQIKLSDSKLYFYYADPETQALKEPIVEPFDTSK